MWGWEKECLPLRHRDVDKAESELNGNCVRTNVWHWDHTWAPAVELLKSGEAPQPKPQHSDFSLYRAQFYVKYQSMLSLICFTVC